MGNQGEVYLIGSGSPARREEKLEMEGTGLALNNVPSQPLFEVEYYRED